MTGIDLIYAMDGIDEGYIQEARQYQRIIPIWMKGVSIAACFLCVLIIGIFSIAKLTTQPQEVPPAPVAPAETTPAAQEESIIEEIAPEEAAEIFSPYWIVGDSIHYGNTEWGIYTDEVYEKEDLDPDIWSYDTKEKSILSPDYPLSEYPEVMSVSYGFSWMGDNLEFGLYSTIIRYDATQISFDDLYEHRVELFGSPATKEENRAIWLTSDGTELYLSGDDRIISEQLTCNDIVYPHGLMEVDIAVYLENLQPPGGHFGWTYQQHVSQGLLSPENGTEEWITNEDGSSSFYFHSTVELGGYIVPIDYYFGRTFTTDEYVLKQVFVIPPEDIPHQDWIVSIAEPWARKLQENVSGRFVSPVLLAGILTEEEKQLMNELGATKSNEDVVSVFLWPLVSYFYDDGVWQYNGTGAAQYTTIPRP